MVPPQARKRTIPTKGSMRPRPLMVHDDRAYMAGGARGSSKWAKTYAGVAEMVAVSLSLVAARRLVTRILRP